MAKQNKKGKNQHVSSDVVKQLYFNETELTSSIVANVIRDMEVVNATNILKEHDLTTERWVTFDYYCEQIIEAWTVSDPINHKYWWMDKLVNEIGYMVWNKVYNKFYSEWYESGVIIAVPELPKKARNNPESVAGHFANIAVDKFKDIYK